MTKQNASRPWLGCIADDFTGASDLASFLVKTGLKTIQINGLPSLAILDKVSDVDAVVIALKSRTVPADEAVNLSVSSLNALQQMGCQKFYFKYCSTFDSTSKGNIGPVIDALLGRLNEHSALICPALPVNGRTVYQGHLFVFDQLLSDSPMKDHPLTPMRESSVLKMIESQGNGKAGLLPANIIEKGVKTTVQSLNKLQQEYRYVVADTLSEGHLRTLGSSVADFRLVTGGSGLAIGLGKEFESMGGRLRDAQNLIKGLKAQTLLISGSCSSMTQRQVAAYSVNHPVHELNVDKLVSGEQDVMSICTWVSQHKDKAPLITASARPEIVAQNQQKFGSQKIAQLIEETFAAVVLQARDELQFRNFIVAGGETSGAVVSALNIDSFYIGKTIAPGVPMLQTLDTDVLNLALKSGNFGQENFFNQAVEVLTCY